jgi:hypothetical protein
MSKVRLQGPENCGGFSHAGISYQADEDGVIEIPVGEAVTHAYSHGFKHITAKPAPKPLAKAAKGGASEDAISDGSDKLADGEPLKAKGAKAAKGGAE